MKSRLLVLFLSCSAAAFSQSAEKCMTSCAYFSLTVFEAGGTTSVVYDSRSNPGASQSGQPDTLFYELAAGDSAVAAFHALDEMGLFYWADSTSPMHETLVYGTPVYDQAYSGFNGLGRSYEAIWSFTDSALFTFVTPLDSDAVGVVKLTKKAEQAAVIEETDEVAFSVYPNPFSDQLFVRIPDADPIAFALIDATGKTVLAWESDVSQAVDVSALKAGVYLLHIAGNNRSETIRFQKL